ncbi:MAG TPA: Hsp20/alpha crystallin family protein, partial [Nitrospirae bacterium]|nr:Hsp20/alpha crystallin family protein [Nitrospirota bacterium]
FIYSQQTSEEPLADIYETDDDLILEIDLPGIDPDEIFIKAFNDILMIEGIKSGYKQENDILRYLCLERNRGHFRRIIKLPVRVNISGGTAMYSNGVIRIEFPKIQEKVVKIKIEKE